MRTADTPIGRITINKNRMPDNYICKGIPVIEVKNMEHTDETYTHIVTTDQSITWTGQTYSPRIVQSCMDPDKITIYPLEIECTGDKIIFKDHYGKGEWKTGEKLPEIHDWHPKLKKLKCNPCRNCGRC